MREGSTRPAKQVLLATYDGTNQKEFYREKEGVIRVVTEIGKMWVALLSGGTQQHNFNPKTDLVLVVLVDPDYTIAYDAEKIQGGAVYASDVAFGIIVRKPPQYHIPEKANDKVNMPSKILTGSSSENEVRVAMGVNEDYKVICSESMAAIKGPGGQIGIGRDGMIKRGNMVDMSFFSDSKAGVLKQNWIGHIIPQSIVTPFPSYLPDMSILKRIAKIPEAISSMRGVA